MANRVLHVRSHVKCETWIKHGWMADLELVHVGLLDLSANHARPRYDGLGVTVRVHAELLGLVDD